MTASIQACTFPALSAEPVEQIYAMQNYTSKGGYSLERYINREFTLTFKLYEGYINYWVMYDMFQSYYALEQKDKFLADVTITFLDQTGFEFVAVELHEIVVLNLSELELNYSSNTADFKTFTMNFKYNFINVKKRLD